MLNQDFCIFLEYEITKVLKASTNEQLKGFWCDGVMLPNNESEYSEKFVNDNRHIVMAAFIGKTGQDKYELTLRFGKKALRNYARGLDIAECVPSAENPDCLDIDALNKKAVIQLD
jgi:hypothetical protein